VTAEVVVVGAGPAGAMAAATLAARGVRTILLDRETFPRDKPCGGGIRHGVWRRFPHLREWLTRRVALHAVHKVRMESPSGATVVAALDAPLYLTFRRLEWDAALVEHARAQGALLVERARVVDVSRASAGVRVHAIDGRVFEARAVIGADGVNSVVARVTGLTTGFTDEQMALDTMEETDLTRLWMPEPDTMYVVYGYRGWPGYGYVFPKARCVDAGVGVLVSFYKRSLGGPPYAHHRRFLEEAGARNVVQGASQRENFRAYRLPLGGPLPRTTGDRVILCGDAGGFVNAYTGEGIYFAMVAGEHAGTALAEALATGDLSAAGLGRYEAGWRAEIGEELADSVRIQRRLLRSPRMADRLIRAAARDPTLSRLLARVALGDDSLRRRRWEIAWRVLLASVRPARRSIER
jgi:geranylgeranyl reductase family protein